MDTVERVREILVDHSSTTEIDYSEGIEVQVLLPHCYLGEDTVRVTLSRDFVRKLYMGFLENDYPPASTGFDQETDKMLYGMFVYQEQVSGGNPDQDVVETFLEERGYDGPLFVNYAYHYIDELDSKYNGCIANPG